MAKSTKKQSAKTLTELLEKTPATVAEIIVPETIETVETKEVKQRVKKSRFEKFNHLANIFRISENDRNLIKNYMLFNLAGKKTKVDFNEYSQEVLYKFSMDSEFQEKVRNYN